MKTDSNYQDWLDSQIIKYEEPVVSIGVYSTGDTWDVAAHADDSKERFEGENEYGRTWGDEVDVIWCQSKAEAIKVARKLFNLNPTAKKLIVDRKNSYDSITLRERS